MKSHSLVIFSDSADPILRKTVIFPRNPFSNVRRFFCHFLIFYFEGKLINRYIKGGKSRMATAVCCIVDPFVSP